ncbi:MAG: VWA domain-containing protein, partial [Rhodothermia bacterium]|nr:VWA domain-containing protein [Rhodothermia bacterium]
MSLPHTLRRTLRHATSIAALSLCIVTAAAQDTGSDQPLPAPDIMLILDASGSMWGKIGDQYKISAAQEVIKDLAGNVSTHAELGLIAYGHREKGDCADIELLIPMGSVDVTTVAGAVDALNPTGMT